jgi:serine/threonine-protein phosphatase 5
MCHMQILKPQLAVTDLKKVLAIEPQNAQVRKELESTQKLIRKIEFEKAIEVEEEKTAVERCLEIIAEGAPVVPFSLAVLGSNSDYSKGACEVEKTYEGPKLEKTDDGKYKITIEFIRSMIQWYKAGKTLPRRYAWEIILGAHDHFVKEESLVDVKVENDVTITVIGDVHGTIRSLRAPGTSKLRSFSGQLYDVMHLLSLTGEPSPNRILLMNGDLVDRGSWSVEVILIAFALKCQ